MNAWTFMTFIPFFGLRHKFTLAEFLVLDTFPIPLSVSDRFCRFKCNRCTADSEIRLSWEPLSIKARQIVILAESSTIGTKAVGMMPEAEKVSAWFAMTDPETSPI